MALNQESRTKNAGRNAVSAVTNKLIILLLTFISRKFFIKYIGIEYLGINGLFSNILTLLSMADLGLGTAMNVNLYKPIAEKDTRKISALLNYYRKIYYYIALAVLVVGLSLTPFLDYIVNTDKDIPYLKVYYCVFVIKNVISYLFIYKSSIINADQKAHLINRIDIFVNISRVALQIILVILFHNYFLYILAEVLQVTANNLIISHIADKNYPFIKKRENLRSEEKTQIFSDISSVFIYKISWALLSGTDNILMSIIVGTVYVGMYSNYSAVTVNVESFVALLFTAVTAGIGNLVATSTPERKYQTFRVMQMFSFWIGAIITICLFFLLQDFIELWFGKELLLDNLSLIAIVLNSFFSICMRPVWTFREGTGMYRQIRYIMLITALLNLVLSIALGKILGLSGILFATSISKISTYFWYEPNLLFRNFFNKGIKDYYKPFFVNILMIVVCGTICFLFNKFFINGVSIVNWLIKAVVCVIVVNVVYFLYYFKSEEFGEMKAKAMQIIKRR